MSLASILEAAGMSTVPVLLFLKATCLLLAALAATFVMMRASSGARHLVWLVVLSALLVLPVIATWSPLRFEVLPSALATRALVTAATPLPATQDEGAAGNRAAPSPVPLPVPQASPSSDTRAGALANGAVDNASASSAARDLPVSSESRAAGEWGVSFLRSTRTVGESLLAVWLIVSVALLAWLAYGAWSVRRIVRRASPLEDPAWQTPLYEIADRFRLADAPRLVRSEDVHMPFACGVLRPTIVLPAEADTWNADRRSAVLLHELGHVQRRDLIGHTLGRLACALYWFHPLVWTAARRLRAESERACDDLALSCGAKPSDYAEHLLDIVTCVRNHATPSIALAMAHRKEFEGRMLAILNPELERTRPSRRQSLSLVGALALLCIVVSAAAPVADAKSPSAGMAMRETSGSTRMPDRDAMAAHDSMTARPGAAPTDGVADGRERANDGLAGDTVQDGTRFTSTVKSVVTNTHISTSTNNQTSASVNVSPAGDDGARALELIGQRAMQSLGSLVSSALSASAKAAGQAISGGVQSAPPAAQATSDERPALLARVLRTDSSSTLRRIAAWGLHEYAMEDVAADALVAAIERDNNASVREMAAWSLSEAHDTERVVSALIAMSRRETDARARATALWTIGTAGNEKGLDVLASAASSDDTRVREIAIWGIGTISPSRVPAAVTAALNDKEPRVRLLAVWAHYIIQDEKTVPALEAQLRRETNREVQVAIVRALAATGEQSVSVLKELIESNDQELRATAIRALAGAGGFSPWPWPWPDPRPVP